MLATIDFRCIGIESKGKDRRKCARVYGLSFAHANSDQIDILLPNITELTITGVVSVRCVAGINTYLCR